MFNFRYSPLAVAVLLVLFAQVAAGQLTITTSSPLPAGTVNVAYLQTLTATGGTPPYVNWLVTVGSLPPGVTLGASTGQFTGTPTSAGTYNFTVQVSDSATPTPQTASKPFALTINPPALSITTASPLPAGTVNVAYLQTLTATGGTPPYVNWLVTVGSLPPGVTLGASTGQFTGTPTSAGTYNFTVQVSDSATPTPQTASAPFALTIAPPPLSITTTSPLPGGIVGAAYSQSLAATGGTTPYIWSATGLPAWLTLNPATGAVTGTPPSPATHDFTVQVTDSGTPTPQVTTRPLSVTVTSPTPSITTLSPNTAVASGLGFTLTVNGTNFVTGAVVNWNAVALTTTFVSATQVTAAVPAANIATAGSAAITVSNPGPVTSAPAAFTIIAPLTITTAALPSGTTGVAYSATLQATGGTGSLTWSVPSGLPGWLTLSALTGALTGTPTAAGTYFFTVRVTDSGAPTPQIADKPLSVTVASGLTVVTSSLAAATVGSQYSQTLTAAGGIAPYSWAVTAGSLPPGLNLSTAGQISGAPTAVGTLTFTVQVSDSAAATATKSLSITVLTALTIITTTPLPDGAVGRSYSLVLTASGGTPPYVNWQVVSGALPSGVTLSAQAGFLSGIPVAPGSSTFAVQVTDSASATATKFFTLTVSSSLTISTPSLPGGATGVSYAQTLAATGGTSPYAWTVASGSLPPGITLTPATGALSGLPTTAGSYAFSIRVTDSASVPAAAAREFVLVISEGLTVTAPSQLPSGSAGVAYSTTLTAAGGRTPYTWSVASGSLPPGLALNSSTGALSGTPTAAGTYSFVLQVTDSTPTSATKAVTLIIAAGLSITSPAQLPTGVTGAAYSQTLTAAGGTAPYTWAVTQGQLPAGLSLSTGGAISGTPTITGSFNFTVQVIDNTGGKATQELSLTIASGLTITTEATLPAGTLGVSYAQTLSAAGGAAPYSDWKVTSGILPAGLSLDAASGRISGTPTTAGTLKFTVQVKDASGKTGSKEFTLTIQAAALTLTTASPLPAGVLGRTYSQTLQATGGVAPYTWAVREGSLPAGLNLTASTGQISGTPTAPGVANFTLEVTDSTRRTASKTFSLSIELPPLPAVQIVGPPDTAEPAQQPVVRLTLASGYPLAITGQLTLTFEPDAVNPSDDPAVVFSTGGRTVNYSIAANATQATFPAASLALQSGTVAGAITLRATLQAGGRNITPSPAPVKVSRLLRSAPVIRSVQVERTSSGFDVVIKGFSTPRQITQATFRFTPAAGANLQTTELTLPLTTVADPWFQGQESGQYGSQFTLRQPFSVQGDSRAVSAVSVTLTNSVGSSQAASAGL